MKNFMYAKRIMQLLNESADSWISKDTEQRQLDLQSIANLHIASTIEHLDEAILSSPTAQAFNEFTNQFFGILQEDLLNVYPFSEEDKRQIEGYIETAVSEFRNTPFAYTKTGYFKSDSFFQNIQLPIHTTLLEKSEQSPLFLFSTCTSNAVGEVVFLDFTTVNGLVVPRYVVITEPTSFPTYTNTSPSINRSMTLDMSTINATLQGVEEATGNVLVGGLNFGYFAYHASQKEDVKTITIYEEDAELIKLFKKSILPQFPNKHKIKVVHQQAENFLIDTVVKKEFLRGYDYVYLDLWDSSSECFFYYQTINRYATKMERHEALPPIRFRLENILITQVMVCLYSVLSEGFERYFIQRECENEKIPSEEQLADDSQLTEIKEWLHQSDSIRNRVVKHLQTNEELQQKTPLEQYLYFSETDNFKEWLFNQTSIVKEVVSANDGFTQQLEAVKDNFNAIKTCDSVSIEVMNIVHKDYAWLLQQVERLHAENQEYEIGLADSSVSTYTNDLLSKLPKSIAVSLSRKSNTAKRKEAVE